MAFNTPNKASSTFGGGSSGVKKKKKWGMGGQKTAQNILNAGPAQVAKNIATTSPAVRVKPSAPPAQPMSYGPEKILSNAQENQPAFVPKINIGISKNPDGTIKYQVGDKPEGLFNLTAQEYADYAKQLKGAKGEINLTPNLQALIDYENAATAINKMERAENTEGITSPAQQMIYNRMTAGKTQEELAQYADYIKAQQAIQPTPMETEGTPLQSATFGLTGAASGAGLTATGITAGAAALGTAGAAAAIPITLAAAGGLIGAEISLSKQARAQNIALAKNQAKESASAINSIIDEAGKARTMQDKMDLIAAFENRRREIKSAKSVLTGKSFMDANFWVDKGGDELYDIEVWEEGEARLVRDFYANLFPMGGAAPVAGSGYVPGLEQGVPEA